MGSEEEATGREGHTVGAGETLGKEEREVGDDGTETGETQVGR